MKCSYFTIVPIKTIINFSFNNMIPWIPVQIKHSKTWMKWKNIKTGMKVRSVWNSFIEILGMCLQSWITSVLYRYWWWWYDDDDDEDGHDDDDYDDVHRDSDIHRQIGYELYYYIGCGEVNLFTFSPPSMFLLHVFIVNLHILAW